MHVSTTACSFGWWRVSVCVCVCIHIYVPLSKICHFLSGCAGNTLMTQPIQHINPVSSQTVLSPRWVFNMLHIFQTIWFQESKSMWAELDVLRLFVRSHYSAAVARAEKKKKRVHTGSKLRILSNLSQSWSLNLYRHLHNCIEYNT